MKTSLISLLYALTLAQVPHNQSVDEHRVTAQKVIAEAELLVSLGAVEARRRAIEKFSEALPHWRAIKDREEESKISYCCRHPC